MLHCVYGGTPQTAVTREYRSTIGTVNGAADCCIIATAAALYWMTRLFAGTLNGTGVVVAHISAAPVDWNTPLSAFTFVSYVGSGTYSSGYCPL